MPNGHLQAHSFLPASHSMLLTAWPVESISGHVECLVTQAACVAKDTEIQQLQVKLQQVREAAALQENAARRQTADIRLQAEQRQTQLSVIMETLEALQSGSDGEHAGQGSIRIDLRHS